MLQRNKKATPSPTRELQPPDKNYNNDEEDEVIDPAQIYRDACKKANKNPLPQILQGYVSHNSWLITSQNERLRIGIEGGVPYYTRLASYQNSPSEILFSQTYNLF
jgi:hypothetical protein